MLEINDEEKKREQRKKLSPLLSKLEVQIDHHHQHHRNRFEFSFE